MSGASPIHGCGSPETADSSSGRSEPRSTPLGRVLGVDLGRQRVGVAISDSGRLLATPFTTIGGVDAGGSAAAGSGAGAGVGVAGEGGPGERCVSELVGLVDQLGAVVVVVGLPLSLDGRHTAAARASLAVMRQLRQALGRRTVEVVGFDERFTTVTAERALGVAGRRGQDRRRVVDQAAATVMLQAWLDQDAQRRAGGESRRRRDGRSASNVPHA